jgi:predicted aconitase with swiveling domain
MKSFETRVLMAGTAKGPVLRLEADISFWGGVDPRSGVIIDSRHPQHGEYLKDKILVMRRSIGSSSGSSVLLELFRRNCAPSGIILVEPDLVICLGVVVAREMSLASIPLLQLKAPDVSALPPVLEIGLQGEISPCSL